MKPGITNPELGDHGKSMLTLSNPMVCEKAAHHGACPAFTSPTVDVDMTVLQERGIDINQYSLHELPGGDAQVLIGNFITRGTGFRLEDRDVNTSE